MDLNMLVKITEKISYEFSWTKHRNPRSNPASTVGVYLKTFYKKEDRFVEAFLRKEYDTLSHNNMIYICGEGLGCIAIIRNPAGYFRVVKMNAKQMIKFYQNVS